MATGSEMRIELLARDNYESWVIHMRAILRKKKLWKYVDGTAAEPPAEGTPAEITAYNIWREKDEDARAEIELAISPSHVKIVKNCEKSSVTWAKLKETYQSKGPAKKAMLLKQLIVDKMKGTYDVREHVKQFFDIVDKLEDMEVVIHKDVLSTLLLYSLPASFENFRCAIESRDELPDPETLRIKIIEEGDARKGDTSCNIPGANAVSNNFQRQPYRPKTNTFNNNAYNNRYNTSKIKCFRCHKFGHKAPECKSKGSFMPHNYNKGNVSLLATTSQESDCNIIGHVKNIDQSSLWCIDSGCTNHLCNDLDKLNEMSDCEQKKLSLANGESTKITAKGKVQLKIKNSKGQMNTVNIEEALHVPDLKMNLLSVGKITDKGMEVLFKRDKAIILNNYGESILKAERIGSLYYVSNGSTVESNQVISKDYMYEMWHRKLGHLNQKDVYELSRRGIIPKLKGADKNFKFECDICLQGKMTRAPFPKKSNRSTEMLEIIHSDVCGPMRTESLGKSKYFLTFTDDYSRFTEVYFIRHKSEVFQKFKEFKAKVEKLMDKQIKYLQSDNGLEYVNREFDEYLCKNGIQRRLTTAYCPEQNGISERKNRTLVEMTKCLLIQANLPPTFWAEALSTANYIRNRCPTSSLDGKTPYEMWFNKLPNINYFKEFGCNGYTLKGGTNRGKFDTKTERCIFIGYSDQTKGYKVWLPDKKRFETVRNVKFIKSRNDENKKYEDFYPDDHQKDKHESNDYQIVTSQNEGVDNETEQHQDETDDDEIIPNDSSSSEENFEDARTDEIQTPQRGRGRPSLMRTGLRGRPRKVYAQVNPDIPSIYDEETNIAEVESVYAAEVMMDEIRSDSQIDEWLEAMSSEMKSIIKNKTWEIIERPQNKNIIGSRFVLNTKRGPDGQVERKKARLVAKGYAQRPGVEFNDTFSPVTRMNSIRLMMSLAARYDMKINQIDVTTAYLNGVLEENIFMEIPKYFNETMEYLIKNEANNSEIKESAIKMLNESKKGNKVCYLKKALYGLKQAGRQWFLKLSGKLNDYGLKQSKYDPCVFYSGKHENLLMVCVYVDDILISCKDKMKIIKLRESLEMCFDIKNLGDVSYCLGTEFEKKGNTITMRQSNYIQNLLQKYNMTDANPSPTPMVDGSKLERSIKCDEKPYRELIGSLNYLAICTRPDIAHAVSVLGQFNDFHGQDHWAAAKRVLRYLKGTKDVGLIYGKGNDPLIGYVDADWGGNTLDRKSYTGCVFTLGNTAISWRSQKQRTVAMSSAEAEYIGLAEAAKEALFLNNFLIELGFEDLVSKTIYNDSQSAQHMTKNVSQHNRTKHIDVRYHFIKDLIEKGVIIVQYMRTEEMIADVLTKSLSRYKHEKCTLSFGLNKTSALRGSVGDRTNADSLCHKRR